MKHSWQHLSLLLATEAVVAQRVIEASVQHFQSNNSGPWQPLLSLGFGTPAQEITGIFDTGSSDTIIPQAGSDLCKVKNQQCAPPAPIVRGQFDPKKASDVKALTGERFNASFSGGDVYDGEFIKTTVSVGGDKGKVPDAQVALASGGQPAGDFPQFAIFGVGPKGGEATDKKYTNLPQRMKDAGAIKGNSFSVVLNPTPFANGSVFFGGIDRSKFTGELQQVALDPDNSGQISDFVVKMTSLHLEMGGKQAGKVKKEKEAMKMRTRRSMRVRATHNGRKSRAKGIYGDDLVVKNIEDDEIKVSSIIVQSNGNGKNGTAGKEKGTNGGTKQGKGGNGDNGGVGKGTGDGQKNSTMINLGLKKQETFTLMDTGGVDVILPEGVLKKMAKALGTSFSANDGLGPVDCKKLNSANKLVMGFNNDTTKISVSLDNMRVSPELIDPVLTAKGLCEVGVTAVRPDDNLNSMGFPFFASVYTVFDLETNSLWFAQAALGGANGTSSKLEEFP